MSETRNSGPGVFVGGDSGVVPPPPAGVTSFNGRTGAVVSAVGDYLAALRYGAALEAASFAAVEGVVHVIDSDNCDPPITMTLPAVPTANAVLGFVFSTPTGPVPTTAGINLDPQANNIAGFNAVVPFFARFPNGPLFFQWSVAANGWQPVSWTDFALSSGSSDKPQIMVRRGVTPFGRALFPLTLNTDDSIPGRSGGGDIQELVADDSVGQGAFLGNFTAPYLFAGGLTFHDRETYAQGLRTLLPWMPVQGGGFTAIPNRAYPIAPAAGTVVPVLLPLSTDLLGGEMVGLVNRNLVDGFTVNGNGASILLQNRGPAAQITVRVPCGVAWLQFNIADGAWYEIYVSDDPTGGPFEFFGAAIAAAGGTVDLPGPASGFIRLHNFISIVPDVAATPMSAVSAAIQQPPGTTTAPLSAGAASGAGGTSATLFNYTAIGFGESIRITNGPASGAGRVNATYRDIPADNITLIRQVLGVGGVTLIPAPPAGFFRRFLKAPIQNGQQTTLYARQQWFNGDTVPHTVSGFLGGNLMSRNIATAANGASVFVAPTPELCVTAASGALTAATAVAVVTTAPVFSGAYETLAL